MTIAYLRTLNPVGEFQLVEIVSIDLGATPPPRPHPQPPLGIWGPTDPRPTPPIHLPPGYPGSPPGFWGPPGPWPTPPIHLPPGVEVPPGMQPMQATVIPMPVSDPPAVPPAGIPPDSTQMLLWFGPGTKPTVVWVPPYVSTGPV